MKGIKITNNDLTSNELTEYFINIIEIIFSSVADLPLPDTPIDRMNWKILVDTATEALRKVSAGAQIKEPEMVNHENRDHSWSNMNGATIINSSSTNKLVFFIFSWLSF